jgi:hypothetical protein
MTVAELGQYRGTSKASAACYVRRKRWRRQTDNRGIVRVLVPSGDADGPQDGPPAAGPPSLVVLRIAIAARSRIDVFTIFAP